MHLEAATNERQVPWEYGSLTGEFYFRAPGKAPADEPEVAAPSAAVDREALFWQTIKDSDRPGDFQEYLKQFPEGLFAGLARGRFEALMEQQTALVVPPKPEIEIDPVEAEYVAVKNANVRAEPTVRSAKVTTLKRGTTVQVAGKVKGGNWYLVERDDKPLGYVYGDLLKELEAPKLALAAPPKPSPTIAPQPAVGTYPPQSGKTFRDCADCPEMVVIPAGSFVMGAAPGEAGRYDFDEGPRHRVTIPGAFALGKYEVTFAEWDACARAGGCSHRPKDKGWGRGNRPVIYVSWDDANEYVRWLSRQTGRDYRLPSEAEWEYAARAGTTTAFHFGDRISPSRANYDGNFSYKGGPKGRYRQRTLAVGSFPANAFGLHDVHGNIWEWVEDSWKRAASR